MFNEKEPSAYFVIRNSISHERIRSNDSNDDDDQVALQRQRGYNNDDDDISSSSDDDKGVAPTVAIVHLVEEPRGMYMLDLADESYMANFIVDNEISSQKSNANDDQYVDIRAWNQLKEYSVLVGKPMKKEDRQQNIISACQSRWKTMKCCSQTSSTISCKWQTWLQHKP